MCRTCIQGGWSCAIINGSPTNWYGQISPNNGALVFHVIFQVWIILDCITESNQRQPLIKSNHHKIRGGKSCGNWHENLELVGPHATETIGWTDPRPSKSYVLERTSKARDGVILTASICFATKFSPKHNLCCRTVINLWPDVLI